MSDDPLIGRHVGPYRLDGLIARGGMGVVYRAEHVRLARAAAVKLMNPELVQDVTYRERFEREARAAAALDHPNVLTIYDYGESDGQLYIAMQHVDGPDLAEVLSAEGRLAPDRAARVIAQAAAGLDSAHMRGLVHRDVKPANLLIERPGTAEEHVYVTDFGLIRAVSASQSGLTRAGGFLGTLDYVAPEQIAEEPIDGRADVYGLGCVLYRALSGDLPFPKESGVAKMHAHLHEPPPRLADPEIAARFGPVVERAMAKQPHLRYPSAGELGRAALAAAGADAGHSGIAFPAGADAAQATEQRPTVPMGADRPPRALEMPDRPFTPPTTPSPRPTKPLNLSPGWVALVLLLLGAAAVGFGLIAGAADWINSSLTVSDAKRFALVGAIAGAVAAPLAFLVARRRDASSGVAAGLAIAAFVVVLGGALAVGCAAIAVDCATEDLACR